MPRAPKRPLAKTGVASFAPAARLRLFEAVLAAANDAVVITEAEPLDPPGPSIVYVNDAFTTMTGYAPEEVIGRTPRILQGPETDAAEKARIRAALDERETVRAQLLNYRKDGSSFWVELVIVPVYADGGQLTHWASVQRETTSARPAREEEAHARATEARREVDAILESITDAFVAMDSGWRITHANRRASELLGCAPDTDFFEVCPSLRETELEGAIRTAMLERRRIDREGFVPRLDAWLDVHAYPVADGLSITVRDISERKRMEEALRASEARLAGIVDLSGDAIVSIDEAQRITLFNQGAEAMFGYSASEVLGKPIDILIPEPLREVHRAHVEEFGRSEGLTRHMGERRVFGRRKNGEVFPAEGSISKLEIEGERVYTSVLRDVTVALHAEQALQQANEHLRALIRASPIAVVALDLEGRVEIWNEAAERMFGWKEEEVLGLPAPTVPETAKNELRREIRLAQQGRSWTGNVTTRLTKSGAQLDVSVSTAPLHDAEGGLTGVLVLLEDITDRLEVERQQRRLAGIIEATPDIVGTIDPEGRILYLNRAGLEWAGGTGVGRSIVELVPERVAALLMRESIPTAVRRGFWRGETAVSRSDGKEVPTSQVIVAHRDRGGELEYLSTVIRDISERKASEQRQQFLAEASRELSGSLDYDEVLRTVQELLVPVLADYCLIDVVDEESGLVVRAATRHRDLDKEALLAKTRQFPPRGSRIGIARALRTGEPEIVPDVQLAWLRAVTRSEEHFELMRALAPRSVLIAPLRARGRIFGAITCAYAGSGRTYGPQDAVLAQDLAGRVALALDNTHLYGEAQQAVRVRDEVLRIVAHDLRNPLNTISLNAQLLLGGVAATSSAAMIQRSVERANALIDDLLDVARVEAGTLALSQERDEPARLVGEALDLHRALAGEKKLHLASQVPADLPPIWVDRSRMLQLFGNLIGNAIKFTPADGTITVSAEPGEGELVFAVSDTGRGMTADQVAHAFDPFWQAQAASRAGAGLGLSISRGIVEAHGGRIWVESEIDRGTTFFFTVPLADAMPQ